MESRTHEAKTLVHHAVGTITLTYHTFAVCGDGDQYLVVCQAEPGSDDERSLHLLAR